MELVIIILQLYMQKQLQLYKKYANLCLHIPPRSVWQPFLQKFEMDNKKEKYFLSFSRNKKCLEGKNSLFMVVKGTKMEFNHLNDDNLVFETLNVKGTKKNSQVKKTHSKTKKR